MRIPPVASAFLLLSFSAALVFCPVGKACDCGRAGPACAYTAGAKASFVGKVTFTNDDGSGTFKQQTLVRFEVEEAFQGLPANVREVWIDPGSFTSCYANYLLGSRYLVFAYQGGTLPPDTVATSVAGGGTEKRESKPLPAGLDPTKPLTVYLAPECSGTRLIDATSEKEVAREVEYLRKAREGVAKPRVTGRVTEDASFGIFDTPTLSGVEVVLTGGPHGGEKRSTTTDDLGQYAFEDVLPGEYTVEAKLNAYQARRTGRAMETLANVSSVGCAVMDFDMLGTGVIEGQVVDHDGHPAPNVKLTVLRLGLDLQPIFYAARDARSDTQGRYRFDDLPHGDFALGVNLFSAADAHTPYAPTKWSVGEKSSVHLDPGQRTKLSNFQLPSPSSRRTISVDVRWPDGSPAANVDVWAEVDTRAWVHATTDSSGRSQLVLLDRITYNVSAKIWVGSGTTREVAASEISHFTPEKSDSGLKLVLSKRTKTYI